VATFRELLNGVKGRIREIAPAEARALHTTPHPPVFIDVREAAEVEQGQVPGAIHIPRGYLELRVEDRVPDHATPIVVYCAAGTRSAFAADTLQAMGYQNVQSLAGGFTGWKDAGFPFEIPRALSPDQKKRYSRHILIPEIGERGQAKLLQSKVLMIGAGGLGCPAALYLAAAGVGTMGIIDSDVVDETNLQRQILHTTERVGMPKTESARLALTALNPDVQVDTYQERLSRENAAALFEKYDLIVDGSDNFATRYLINDASVLARKPVVHGSIFRFEGQATVFVPFDGPCYRCVFPEAPPVELAPT
jgi:molybdopterin/thiamine biosynthesis adenylyltransferase/rhodanese-related sulfurtransferase